MLYGKVLLKNQAEIIRIGLGSLVVEKIKNKEIDRIFQQMMKANQEERISAKNCLDQFSKINIKDNPTTTIQPSILNNTDIECCNICFEKYDNKIRKPKLLTKCNI